MCLLNLISVTDIQPIPYPKAGPRVQQRKGRKKGTSRILTETPEINIIEQEYKERLENKKTKKKTKNKRPTTKSIKRKLIDVFSEKSDEDLEDNTITYGDFVLVKYNNGKSSKFFVGCVDDYDHHSYEVSFF